MCYEFSDYEQADATEQVTRRSACKRPSRAQGHLLVSSVQVRHGAICQKTSARWTENWVRFAKSALAALCEPSRSAPPPCPRATIVVGRSQAGAAIRPA